MKARALWLPALLTLLFAGGLAYYADSSPDALEHSLENAREHPATGSEPPEAVQRGLFPDYATPGVEHPYASGAIAGLAGVGAVFVVLVGLAWLLKRGRARTSGRGGA